MLTFLPKQQEIDPEQLFTNQVWVESNHRQKREKGEKVKNGLKNGPDSNKFVLYDFAHSAVFVPLVAVQIDCVSFVMYIWFFRYYLWEPWIPFRLDASGVWISNIFFLFENQISNSLSPLDQFSFCYSIRFIEEGKNEIICKTKSILLVGNIVIKKHNFFFERHAINVHHWYWLWWAKWWVWSIDDVHCSSQMNVHYPNWDWINFALHFALLIAIWSVVLLSSIAKCSFPISQSTIVL